MPDPCKSRMPTGLFFGSFNPFHKGHLAIARYLLEGGHCREIWFVVSPQNPLKQDKSLLDEEKRIEIVRAAIAGDERMKACDIEFAMPRPSYTADTLRRLEDVNPGMEFALVIGGDNLRDFHLWRNHEEIARHYRILVYPRPGVETPSTDWKNVSLVDAPLCDISSTRIREMIRSGQDVSSFVPDGALRLIEKYY